MRHKGDSDHEEDYCCGERSALHLGPYGGKGYEGHPSLGVSGKKI